MFDARILAATHSRTEACYVGRSAISCARAADHMADRMKKRILEIHRRSKRPSSPQAPLSKVALQVSTVFGFLLLGCAAPEDRATDREGGDPTRYMDELWLEDEP